MCRTQFAPSVYKRQRDHCYSTDPYGGVLDPFKTIAMEPTRKSSRLTGPPDFLGDMRNSDVAIGALNARQMLVDGASELDVAAANVYFHDDTLTRYDAEIAVALSAAAAPSQPRSLTRHDAEIAAALSAAAAPSVPRIASNGAAAGSSSSRGPSVIVIRDSSDEEDDGTAAAGAWASSNGRAGRSSRPSGASGTAGASSTAGAVAGPPAATARKRVIDLVSEDDEPEQFDVQSFFAVMPSESQDADVPVFGAPAVQAAAGASFDVQADGVTAASQDADVPVFGAPAVEAAAGASFDVQADGVTAVRTVSDSTGTTRVSRWTKVDGVWTKNSV